MIQDQKLLVVPTPGRGLHDVTAGLFLAEHRTHPHRRRLVVHVTGESARSGVRQA